MMETDAARAFEEMAAQIEEAAKATARAQAESQALARQNDPSRWRRAALLWPIFTGG